MLLKAYLQQFHLLLTSYQEKNYKAYQKAKETTTAKPTIRRYRIRIRARHDRDARIIRQGILNSDNPDSEKLTIQH